MAEEIVLYKDRDGAEISLTPQDVVAYCASGGAQLTQRDVVNFMATCKALGANPYLGDVYLVKYKNGEQAQIMAGKNYYTRVAVSIPTYDGMTAGIVCITHQGQVAYRTGSMTFPGDTCIGGWAEVHDKRWSVPVRSEVAMEEYNSQRSLWKSKPLTMIRKVALVQALREAYPDRFAGTYDQSEMGGHAAGEVPAPEPIQVQVMAETVPRRPQISDEDKAMLAELADELDGWGVADAKRLLWQAYQQGGMETARAEHAARLAEAKPREVGAVAEEAAQAAYAGEAEAMEMDLYEEDFEF